MMDCLSYITPGSNDTKPTKVCCGGILSVLQYNPTCVCVGLESSKTMGFAVNNTRARAMPTTCKLPIVATHCREYCCFFSSILMFFCVVYSFIDSKLTFIAGVAMLDEVTPAASSPGMSLSTC